MFVRTILATSILAAGCARVQGPVQAAAAAPGAALAQRLVGGDEAEAVVGAAAAYLSTYDVQSGGFAAVANRLDAASVEVAVAADARGFERAGAMAQKTLLRGLALLDKKNGGVFDSDAGAWTSPSQVKSLAAQANALDAYRAGFDTYGTGVFGAAARSIAGFVAAEMLQADGTFAARVICAGAACTREGAADAETAAKMTAALARWAEVGARAHQLGASDARAAAIAGGKALAAANGGDIASLAAIGSAYLALGTVEHDPSWTVSAKGAFEKMNGLRADSPVAAAAAARFLGELAARAHAGGARAAAASFLREATSSPIGSAEGEAASVLLAYAGFRR